MKIDYSELGKQSLKRFRETTDNAHQVQEELLCSMMKKNQDTIYGKKYHFSEIHSLQEYQQSVPISNYSDYAAYIRDLLQGAQAVLTAEPPVYLAISSGSTGEAKYLPVTEASMLIHYRYPYGAIFGMVEEHYNGQAPEEIFGKIFQMSEFATTHTDRGIMNGIASSALYQWLDQDGSFDASDYCAPKEVLFPNTLEDLNYVKVRFALAEPDITAIHSVFVHRVVGALAYIEKNWELLLRDMEQGTVDADIPLSDYWREKMSGWLPPNPERAQQLRQLSPETLKTHMVAKIWPRTKYLLTVGGSSFSSYMTELALYMGDIPVHYFAYAASEGVFGLANGLNCTDQYILVPESGVFEFMPEGEGIQRPLFLHEIKLGKKYALLFTNQSGLYRYELLDVIEVIGFYGQSPIVRYCYRKNQVVNIADEHTDTEQFEQAMQLFGRMAKIDILGYGIQADYSVQPGRYLIYLETREGKIPLSGKETDDLMESCLQKILFGYSGCRNMNEISPAHVALLAKDSFKKYEEHLAASNCRMGQNKPLKILDSPDKCEFFAKMVL